MTEPRIIAEFCDYDGMLAAMRARARERKVALSNERLPGLPDKYLAKLIGSNPVRRIGMLSLGEVSGVLGVRYLMIEDLEALERFGSRLKTRNDNLVHSDVVHRTLTMRFLKKIGRKGGENSRKNLGKRKVKQLARKAAKARWEKPQIVELKGVKLKKAKQQLHKQEDGNGKSE